MNKHVISFPNTMMILHFDGKQNVNNLYDDEAQLPKGTYIY